MKQHFIQFPFFAQQYRYVNSCTTPFPVAISTYGFGSHLLQARKKKGISQEELGTKGPAIGRYERDEMKPSIEAASNMARILEVSLE